MRSASRGSIPIPLSATEKRHASSSRSAETRTSGTNSPANLSAFEIRLTAGHWLERGGSSDPRVRQQVIDELAHPLRRVLDCLEELVPLLVEVGGVTLPKQLREAGYQAQRLREVVCGDRAEPLELRVRALELRGGGCERSLRALLPADVGCYRDGSCPVAVAAYDRRDRQ